MSGLHTALLGMLELGDYLDDQAIPDERVLGRRAPSPLEACGAAGTNGLCEREPHTGGPHARIGDGRTEMW
ncbi:hypothetical protein Ade02nite_21280 [Paractinoplanes deccanensis]|uniref:Uncharacterized protein n=1 Tax=Paractinoplanes deccanensis TaxID=113561 RepID=A0ABQ3Y0F9_9ACTN|nr:hypothetical protein [Actinoplanes deccanensis]GID73487.1 hypothetical protein Ade02nite_21280 [Actinoplanes deccanensis]